MMALEDNVESNVVIMNNTSYKRILVLRTSPYFVTVACLYT